MARMAAFVGVLAFMAALGGEALAQIATAESAAPATPRSAPAVIPSTMVGENPPDNRGVSGDNAPKVASRPLREYHDAPGNPTGGDQEVRPQGDGDEREEQGSKKSNWRWWVFAGFVAILVAMRLGS